MSRFLLLTVLLSAVLPWNYAKDLKLTYQDKIVTCTMITVRERGCVLNLYMGDRYNLVAKNAGITVQYEFKSFAMEGFFCDARCRTHTIGPVEFTVNVATYIGLIVGTGAFPCLIFWCVTVLKKQIKKRRTDLERATGSNAQYYRNTPTVEPLMGPRHEVRASQHTGPASYRREELPRSPPTVPREEPSLAPVHAPPTASRGELNLEYIPHIAPVEALPSYEQALEMISATDIPERRC